MKAEVADKWTEALRSGAYQQGTGQLRKWGFDERSRESAFCCLGVLCDVYAQEHANDTDSLAGLAKWSGEFNDAFMGEEYHLPPVVREWAGMRSDNGALGTATTVIHVDSAGNAVAETWGDNLVDLNDGGASFAEIADVIAQRKEEL